MFLSSVHYEVFAKRPGGAMNLELTHAREDHAVRVAEEMFAGGEFAGVRVVRETLDPETGAFRSAVLLKRGDQDEGKARPGAEEMGPACRAPADLYAAASRAQIARLLEGWLGKVKATPFELLHRLDLAERLQTTGAEMQHAVQKVAVTQSLGRGVGVHQMVRTVQQLVDQAIGRLRADRAAGLFPALAPDTFAAVCRDLAGAADGAYRLAGGVADHLAGGGDWSEKCARLLDLADAAPDEDPARALALQVLCQPLSEILAAKAATAELLGADLDLGGQVAAAARLVANEAVEALAQVDPEAGSLIPPLGPVAQRLAERLALPGYEDIRGAVVRRLLQALTTPRRLRPSDPAEEVELARALGFALSAADPRVLPAEEVRAAIIERSRLMVGQDFLEAFLRAERPAMQEAFDLARLLDNLAGAANRTQAVRWIQATISSPRFDAELTSGPDSASTRLLMLARLHRMLARSRHDAGGVEPLLERLGEMGDRLEASKGLVRQLSRAQIALPHRLGALLRMAAGETAPPGPAAERAKAEAKRLLAAPDAMAELGRDPGALRQLRELMAEL